MRKTGVVLMSYGSPATLEEVPSYLASAYGGHPAPQEVVAEFQRRYALVGGSPLIRITQAQASALETLLNAGAAPGEGYRVVVGMRHSAPHITDALAELSREGIRCTLGIIMSPQYSPIIMGGYHRAVEAAKRALGPGTEVSVARDWHTLDSFVDALAQRTREALGRLPPEERGRVPVLMTAHSLPRSVVERDPAYVGQLEETARAVAERVGLVGDQWQFAYQSAGHTPGEWLRPDIKDLFPGLARAGHRSVLVVPVQFLADHLEVLYDIDIAARAEAEAAGLRMRRIEMPNTMPRFICALAEVVRRDLPR